MRGSECDAAQRSGARCPAPKLEDFMAQPGLDGRHRDKDGEISRKHGNTLVRTLRKIYGDAFARGFSDHQKLSDVLATLDEPSLNQLVRDHAAGTLASKIVHHT